MASAPANSGPVHGPRASTAAGTGVELALGVFLLGLAAVAGLAFIHRPWANRLDVWGFKYFPANLGSHWASEFAKLGSLTVLVVGVIVVFFIGIFRDWVRALACAAAPIIAVLIVQDLAKPLVGRHLGLSGGSSYPSGTVAAVASLAMAATLVMPVLLRPVVAVIGAMATVGTCVAVIMLRWHYPTDALGGVAVGVGAVLFVDAVMHIPWAVASRFRTARPDRNFEAPRQTTLA
jgi:membrane-associated phospholipid phosphatase